MASESLLLAMALTLYGGARSRASMVLWYLKEKGIPCHSQTLDMQAGDHRQESFLAINPFGKVPALVDDVFQGPDGGPLKLAESGAILLHLAENYGAEFAGDPGRAAALRSLSQQWVVYANATLGPAMFQAADRPDDLARQLAVLNDRLSQDTSLLSGAAGPGSWGPVPWGAADCAVQSYLAYLPMFCSGVDLSPYASVQASIEATNQRPAYKEAMGSR
jgi:glutathione S-transferase